MVAFTLTADDAPIADAPVSVSVGSTRVPATTDAAGKASVTIEAADLAAGSQQATISYAGDARFQAATGSVTIQVDPAAATVALTLTPTGTGTTTAAAAISSATGVDAAGTVDFVVDGATVGSQAVSAGQASVELAAGLPIGDHAVVANFIPAQPQQVAAASGAGTLSISKAAATVTASGHSDTVRFGDSGTVNLAVQVATPGVDLTGAVNLVDPSTGAVLAEGSTDAAGTASLDFTNTADPGSTTYTVSYAGNDAVQGSQIGYTFQTTQTDVDFGIVKPTLKPGESGTVTLSVIGSPQTPTGTATITVDGNQIANGALDGNGKISGQLSSVTAGSHDIAGELLGRCPVRRRQHLVDADRQGADRQSRTRTPRRRSNASNPCPASATACVDLSNTQGVAAVRRAGDLRSRLDHVRSCRLPDTGRHVQRVLVRQGPQEHDLRRRADAELGVLQRRHRLPRGQPVGAVARLHPPVVLGVGDVLRLSVGGRHRLRVRLGAVLS